MQHSLVKFCSQSRISLTLLAAAVVSLAVAASPAQAQTYTLQYSFPGGSQGLQPGEIVVTSSGSILGVADYDDCACTLLFNYTGGKETVLHRFPEPQGDEAETPQGLLLGKNGETLYATTTYGGKYSGTCSPGIGCGLALSYDLSTNKYKTMHYFQGGPKDGADPAGTQALDSAGNLYGVTFGGGSNYNGTFYEITAAGIEKVLYSFGNAPDGAHPGSGLVGYGGNYYGITIAGGANVCNNGGCGTVFKVTPSGKETVLYNFGGGTDGQNPYELVGDSKGNLYGLSRNADNVVVAVFEISSTGAFSIAYDGSYVSQIGWIIMGAGGSFYASASGGDSSCEPNGCGQILRLTPTGGGNGTVTVLHQFDGSDGSMLNADAGLVLRESVLYGTTPYGGSSDDGVIYKLTP